MRSKLRNILKHILKVLAVWTLRKYEPSVIGVTGTVGKTAAKDAIHTVLRGVRRARASPGNLNTEFGLPLAILGTWETVGGPLFWLRVIGASLVRLIVRVPYPEILILEYGAQQPGDIKYLLEIARPMIGVVTAVGEIPAHVEFYSGPEAVLREKSRLIEAVPVAGFAVLNADDAAVSAMRERTRAHPITYGFSEGAEVRITQFEHRMEQGKPVGIGFKLEYGGSFVPVRMDRVFGRSPAYAAAAAAAVGVAFNLHLVRISEALAYYEGPPHRMRLVPGMKDTLIVDDSYNASPIAMAEALETLRTLPGRRKVAILGDMLEIGTYTETAHAEVGRRAARIADLLVTIGPRAKFIAEAARSSGLAKKSIASFETREDAEGKIPELLAKRDLVLVKGSRALELEKLVDALRER